MAHLAGHTNTFGSMDIKTPLKTSLNTFGSMDAKSTPITAYLNYLLDQEEGILIYIPAKTLGGNWEQRMQDLDLFKERHGHCRVPLRYNDNPKLGKWVMNVRSNFQFLQGKNNSVSTKEKLQQLQEIDFDFAPKSKAHTKFYVDLWVHHLHELYQFKQKNGHCRVPHPSKTDKKLGRWVKYVRRQYRKSQNGQPNTITPDRLEQLKHIGFDFEPPKGRPVAVRTATAPGL